MFYNAVGTTALTQPVVKCKRSYSRLYNRGLCWLLAVAKMFNSCNRQQPTYYNVNALTTRLYNRSYNRTVSKTNHRRPMRDVTPTIYSTSQHGGGEK